MVAGWLAGKVVRGTGFGLIGDLVVVPALHGLVVPRFGIQLGTGIVQEIIYSALGAIILLVIVRLVRGGGRFQPGATIRARCSPSSTGMENTSR